DTFYGCRLSSQAMWPLQQPFPQECTYRADARWIGPKRLAENERGRSACLPASATRQLVLAALQSCRPGLDDVSAQRAQHASARPRLSSLGGWPANSPLLPVALQCLHPPERLLPSALDPSGSRSAATVALPILE